MAVTKFICWILLIKPFALYSFQHFNKASRKHMPGTCLSKEICQIAGSMKITKTVKTVKNVKITIWPWKSRCLAVKTTMFHDWTWKQQMAV